MRLFQTTALGLLTVCTATGVHAGMVNFDFYVDDYAVVTVDGNPAGSYNNSAAAGNIDFALNLAPGWHSIAIDYANQAGTNFLNVRWQQPGDPALALIPLADMRSLDQNSQWIAGLRGDYYNSLGGSYLFTVYGEGPIRNGATSFTDELYEGNTGLWAGVFGPSALFEERLSGDILVGGVAGTPEPAGIVLAACGLALLAVRRRRRLAPSPCLPK